MPAGEVDSPAKSQVSSQPAYTAPELLKGADVKGSVAGHDGAPLDVWATGLVLYHMLYGHNPFQVPPTSLPPTSLPPTSLAAFNAASNCLLMLDLRQESRCIQPFRAVKTSIQWLQESNTGNSVESSDCYARLFRDILQMIKFGGVWSTLSTGPSIFGP